jgi:hypothetical protein
MFRDYLGFNCSSSGSEFSISGRCILKILKRTSKKKYIGSENFTTAKDKIFSGYQPCQLVKKITDV